MKALIETIGIALMFAIFTASIFVMAKAITPVPPNFSSIE